VRGQCWFTSGLLQAVCCLPLSLRGACENGDIRSRDFSSGTGSLFPCSIVLPREPELSSTRQSESPPLKRPDASQWSIGEDILICGPSSRAGAVRSSRRARPFLGFAVAGVLSLPLGACISRVPLSPNRSVPSFPGCLFGGSPVSTSRAIEPRD
jgi:hypothetical protein